MLTQKQENRKPLVLLTSARTGSTPVYEILKTYFKQHHQMQGAHTILNPYFGTYATKKGKLHFDPTYNTLRGKTLEQAITNRQRLVKRHHGNIFFKIYPHEMQGKFGHWVLENYQFITHERKNIQEQVLSYLVSANLQIWYRQDGIQVKKKSLTARREDFSAIEGSLYVFQHLKKVLKPVASLTYEDFIRFRTETFLKRAGFCEAFPLTEIRLPPKQNNGKKLDLFTNQKEIKSWYVNSWMSDLYPWDN